MTFDIRGYQESKSDSIVFLWDDFVLNKSVNGTFLQMRRFLSYHPKDRYKDDSLMVYDNKGNLCAVCPACCVETEEGKIFYSHKGSTYGGIVISKNKYKAKYVIAIIKDIEEYLVEHGYKHVYLKLTPDILSSGRPALLEYALYYCGYSDYKELNPIIDYNSYNEDILKNFSQGKRTNVHNCERQGLDFRSIDRTEELSDFYAILCENLGKYDLEPVHTLDELVDLKVNRITDECEFFGVFLQDEMIAGGMMFYFMNAGVAHTQYLCAKGDYNKLSPMTYLYYKIIREMKERGVKILSFGICTENQGRYLNEGLINSKESFGGTYSVNQTFYKNFA